jgi:flagellar hook-length control protein FliK
MPFHTFALLASTLASELLNIVGHVAGAASTKGTAAKQSGKKNNIPSGPASPSNAFAAYLATAAASLSAVPLAAVSTVKPSPQNGSAKSLTPPAVSLPAAPSNPERRPLGLLLKSTTTPAVSLPLATPPPTPAGTKNGVLPAAPVTQPEIPRRVGVDPATKTRLPAATVTQPQIAPRLSVDPGVKKDSLPAATVTQPQIAPRLGVDPGVKKDSLPAATVTVKMPTPPTATVWSTPTAPTVSARVPVHATPDSIQAARASVTPKASTSATAKSSASAAPDVSAKPLSPEGKNEIHLGSHTTVESPLLELVSPDHEEMTTNHSVVAFSDLPGAEPQKPAEASSVASVKAEPSAAAATVRLTTTAPGDERLSAPSVSVEATATSRAIPRLFTTSVTGATLAKSSVEPVAHLFNAPASANHAESQPQTSAAPSPAPGTSVTTTLPAPTVAPASQTSPSPAATTVPVAEQLTRAFVAQAEVVQREGRTNFHLRLDPPQLGSVQIHLTATEHTVSARIVVAQEGTRQLLEGQAHHLRQGLAEAGLSLGSFDVTRDGGGSRGGGQQAPPQTPLPLPTFVSTPRTTPTVVPPTVSRPTDGINILA